MDKQQEPTTPETSPRHRIRITVEGGLVQAIDFVPPGIVVEVWDFDVSEDHDDDEPYVRKNEEGDRYTYSEWCADPVDRVLRFKVASVSENTNSFGLYGMILISGCGQAWQVGANSIKVKKKGDIVRVRVVDGHPDFARLGFEIPERLDDPPSGVIQEIWGREVTDGESNDQLS